MIQERVDFNRIGCAPLNAGFRMEGWWVWCGSVVKGEDGRYHMFASRWSKHLPMHPGWLVGSEIVRASCDTPNGEYRFEEVVLPRRGAEYWDGQTTHNPHITKCGFKYILYYTGTTYPFDPPAEKDTVELHDPRVIVARANKRIGIAVSESVFGPWKIMDIPVLPVRSGHFDSYLTSNAAPCVNEDKTALIVYKARAYDKNAAGRMTLGSAYTESYDGFYTRLCEKPIFPEEIHLEDPFIWRSERGYEMIAKDMEGNVCGEIYGGIRAYSKTGIDWSIDKENPKSYSRTILFENGEEITFGSFERPFILFEDRKPVAIYGAVSNGKNGFLDATETWNICIPFER